MNIQRSGDAFEIVTAGNERRPTKLKIGDRSNVIIHVIR